MATIELIHKVDGAQRSLQVIFVHGLGGDIRSTWMCDPTDSSTLWPRWVGEDLHCPIWLVGYDAEVSGWRESAMPLRSQGVTLLDLLSSDRRLQGERFVLVGHSLGGLVIKTALIDAVTLGVERYKFFPRQLRGVVFIATPHFGSHLANLADGLRRTLRTNQQVGDMKMHDAHLANLNTQFRAQHKRLRFAVRSFCEARGVTTGRRLFGLRPAPAIRVVDGADPHVDGDSGVYLPEDHFIICKPQSREAQVYKSLIGFLEDVRESERSPFWSGFDEQLDQAGIVESDKSLTIQVSACEVRVVAGRLENQDVGPATVVVLPCNEYFDDDCAKDPRSALGAYVASKLGGRTEEFMSLVKEQCRLRFGERRRLRKTDAKREPSFGVGRCLLLEAPLGTSIPVALVSTTTQRPGEGLTCRVSDLFSGIEELASQMADTRLTEAVMPVLGAGHGKVTPAAALSGLLLAIAQEARKPSASFKRVTLVVFRKDDDSPLQVHSRHIRHALAVAASTPQSDQSEERA